MTTKYALIFKHYVTMRTDIVGIQYYRGLVGKGEAVMLKRDPGNPYDANAVKVILLCTIPSTPANEIGCECHANSSGPYPESRGRKVGPAAGWRSHSGRGHHGGK
jgi:hypothetical protein